MAGCSKVYLALTLAVFVIMLASCTAPATAPATAPIPTPTPSPGSITVQVPKPLSEPASTPTPDKTLKLPQTPSPTLTPTPPTTKPTPSSTSVEYPAPSVYYPMDNTNVVATRPDGKELYVLSHARSTPILVVDIDSPSYPVVGKIDLPGRMGGHTCISFSHDSKHAYLSHVINRYYEENQNASFSDLNKIIVIDTTKKEVEYVISMPQPYAPLEHLAPSPDGRWLYFTSADFAGKRLGIGKIDLKSQKMVGFLPLEGINFMTVSTDGKYIYATQGTVIGTPPRVQIQTPNLFSIIDTESFQVVSSVSVGSGPWYAGVTPDGSKAYVSNQWSNDVSVVNLKTMKVTATIGTDNIPGSIVFRPDGTKAYVTIPGTYFMYQFGDTVTVIDVNKDIALGTIKVHIEPLSIAMDPDGTRAYVSDGNANGSNPSEIHIIDTVNDAYLRPIILRAPARVMPTAIDVTPDGRELFVVSEAVIDQKSRTSLLAIDATTGAVLGKMDIQSRGVKVSGDGNKVYVFCEQQLLVVDRNSLAVIKSIDLQKIYPNYPAYFNQDAFRIVLNQAEDTAYLVGKSAEVVVIDMTKGEVKARIPFAKAAINHSRGLALTPDDRKLFVSDYNSETVVVIDTSSNAVVANIPVAPLPSEIKISKDGKRAYVLQQQNPTIITIIDVETYRVIKTLSFVTSALMDFELSLDERYAYVPDFDPNFLLIYDLIEGKTVKIIDVGIDPFNIASTPDKKLIYITNFTTDDISVVDTTTNSVVKTIKINPPTK